MIIAIAIRWNTNKDYQKEKDEVHNDNYDDVKIVDYDGNDDDGQWWQWELQKIKLFWYENEEEEEEDDSNDGDCHINNA